jgi:flagellar hook assembly protein FlgD
MYYMVLRNYPNPFNAGTTLFFDLLTPSMVDVEVYNLLGSRIRTLATHQLYEVGEHSVFWDSGDDAGRAVASGIYFARLNAGTRVLISKMALIR